MSVRTASMPDAPADGPSPAVASPRRPAVRLPRSGKAMAGLVIVAAFAVLALIGPWVAPYGPTTTVRPACTPRPRTGSARPTSARTSSPSCSTVPARPSWSASSPAWSPPRSSVIIGISAGYLGGDPDEGLSLTANVFLTIPALPLLIVISSYLPAAARSNPLFIGAVIIA